MKPTQRLALTLLTLAGVAFSVAANTCAAAADTATSPSAPTALFNGKDFTGWTFFMKGGADPKETWSIKDGLIECNGKPSGYLRTEQSYRDYKLTVEWRFTKPGNTGVLVNMQCPPEKVWPMCIECQGQHDKQGDFWLQGGAECKDHHGKDQRHIPMREPSQEKPVGEWNTYQVECAGSTVRIYVNGTLMNEATDCSVSSGKIGLQSEGGAFEVRKISLEPLPSR